MSLVSLFFLPPHAITPISFRGWSSKADYDTTRFLWIIIWDYDLIRLWVPILLIRSFISDVSLVFFSFLSCRTIHNITDGQCGEINGYGNGGRGRATSMIEDATRTVLHSAVAAPINVSESQFSRSRTDREENERQFELVREHEWTVDYFCKCE